MPNFPKTNISYPLIRTRTCSKKCSFFRKFGVFCFLETPVLRFALLPYYQRNTSIKSTGVILQKNDSKQKLQGRTTVVHTKFEILEWCLLDSVSHLSADTTDVSRKGWGTECQGISTGVQ